MIEYQFEANYLDHFETSLQAYKDIQPVLEAIKSNKQITIYDPFYCQGSQIQKQEVCFNNVINENKDFYEQIKQKSLPKYDVLMTNPPYSKDHKEKILNFCCKIKKPWLLLLPNYIANKQYYQDIIKKNNIRPFYIIPNEKYQYDHPEGTGHQSSPFFSIWYINYGSITQTDQLFKDLRLNKFVQKIRSWEDLKSNNIVPTQVRPNPRKRKSLKKKYQEQSSFTQNIKQNNQIQNFEVKKKKKRF